MASVQETFYIKMRYIYVASPTDTMVAASAA